MWKFLRAILFFLDPETAHAFGCAALRIYGFFSGGKTRSLVFRKVRKEFCGHVLYSPVGLAAGFDKKATMVLGLRSLGFGFVEVGTVTPKPQKGNPRPRVFRVPEARVLVNRMGFNSAGAEAMARRLEHLRAMHRIGFPVGINLGKNRDTPLEQAASDYVDALEKLYSLGDYFVVNVSSPNTPGLTDLQEGDRLGLILDSMRCSRDRLSKRTTGAGLRPLFLKLSPDLSEQARRAAVEAGMACGFDGFILSNTSRRRDFPQLKHIQSPELQESGGLSGSPLKMDARQHLEEVRRWIGPKPWIISVGGVDSVEEARIRLQSGANLVQIYTEFIYSGPSFPQTLAQSLAST